MPIQSTGDNIICHHIIPRLDGFKERKIHFPDRDRDGYANENEFPKLTKYLNSFFAGIKQQLKQNNTSGKKEIEAGAKSIGKLKLRLKNAKDLMLDGGFLASEYKEIKFEIENRIG
ncbi:MAG: hypothetical protein M3R17_04585 [Bacteroidota bacterium]|nr:hypothetical protein [Bacteroidota bacterium]